MRNYIKKIAALVRLGTASVAPSRCCAEAWLLWPGRTRSHLHLLQPQGLCTLPLTLLSLCGLCRMSALIRHPNSFPVQEGTASSSKDF